MKISKLDESVICLLRSHSTIVSLSVIVKELIHNSIDARSTTIKLYIDFRQLSIKVSDNGCGISPSELASVGKRNYTSKLLNPEDFEDLGTYGFRGESLYSISKSARLSIVSKTRNYNSSFIKVFSELDGSVKHSDLVSGAEPMAYSSGTDVIVDSIFYSFPVRRLLTLRTSKYKLIEEIRSIVLYISVSHPAVSIQLFQIEEMSQDRQVIFSTGNNLVRIDTYESYSKILNSIYGINLFTNYEKLQTTFESITLKGIISKKPIESKNYQFMVVNNRPFVDSSFQSMINKLFQSAEFGSDELLQPSFNASVQLSPQKYKSPTKVKAISKAFPKFPVFILYIECPCNVHDVTGELIYITEYADLIKNIIFNTVKAFLKVEGYFVRDIEKCNLGAASDSAPKLISHSKTKITRKDRNLEIAPATSFESSSVSVKELIGNLSCGNDSHETLQVNNPKVSEFLNNISQYKISSSELKRCQVINQVDTKFILVKMNLQKSKTCLHHSNILIVDQHACDERINIESYLKEFILGCFDHAVEMSVPLNERSIQFDVSFNEKDLFATYESNLNLWGIKFTLQNDNSIIITHLPKIVIDKSAKNRGFLKDSLIQYLDDLNCKRISPFIPVCFRSKDWFEMTLKLPKLIIDILNSKACRSSVMFGEFLSRETCKEMISKLGSCKLPFQCAHGRPSIIPLVDLSDFDARSSLYTS